MRHPSKVGAFCERRRGAAPEFTILLAEAA